MGIPLQRVLCASLRSCCWCVHLLGCVTEPPIKPAATLALLASLYRVLAVPSPPAPLGAEEPLHPHSPCLHSSNFSKQMRLGVISSLTMHRSSSEYPLSYPVLPPSRPLASLSPSQPNTRPSRDWWAEQWWSSRCRRQAAQQVGGCVSLTQVSRYHGCAGSC